MTETIKEIKHYFMTYRNGIVADTLRSAGMTCYRIIFGLNVPQLAEVSRRYQQSIELAQALWADKGVRESRLLAAYIFPPQEITFEYACSLVDDLMTNEEADMLCFRLLKRLDFAQQIVDHYKDAEAQLQRYCSQLLLRHIS
jgi:3-methyladenine DNA glycosylase AlkD